ncbi:Protein FAM13B [Larimichthys crocea]|uniref:Uncharacterized protein n=1 Tax=Larimichthys crocea TaxID=215358 RepID=A0ACD3RCL1_LARCR|nr:Protein FAM13B [Larimichthys crocea]
MQEFPGSQSELSEWRCCRSNDAVTAADGVVDEKSRERREEEEEEERLAMMNLITELLDDERCEAECEELPQDGEAGPAPSDSPQHTHSPDDSPAASSHLSPISILPADSAEIIQRTIRAAVEQHFFELKSSIDQDLSNYDSQG